jgi:hypothetical protein
MISNYILILCLGFFGTTLELMSMEMIPEKTAAVFDKKRKQSAYNQKSVDDIHSIFKNSTYSSPEKLSKSLNVHNSMHDTEGKTKQAVAQNIILPAVRRDLEKNPGGLVGQNDQLIQTYQDLTSKRGKFLKDVLSYVDSAEKRRISHLDVGHATGKHITFAPDGEVKKVEGSHNLSQYDFVTEIEHTRPTNAFVDTKGVVGFYVGDTIPKTALPNFTPERALSYLRSGRTIAGHGPNSLLTVTQAPTGHIVESFADKKQPHIIKTLYPVLTIDADQVDADGHVFVGSFSKIRHDLTGADPVIPITIPRDQLLAMMGSGTNLPVKDSTQRFVDVTPQVNTYLASSLRSMGKTEMPGKVYAYTQPH